MNAAMEYFRHIMEVVGTSVDGVGVFIVAGGMLVATARLAASRAHKTGNYYSLYPQDVGRAILLGLEFLIAGDIIRTVVVAPTLQNVVVLGIIVLIRTFLSLSLHWKSKENCPGGARRCARIPIHEGTRPCTNENPRRISSTRVSLILAFAATFYSIWRGNT
jgi:uncharacterized membrane protein